MVYKALFGAVVAAVLLSCMANTQTLRGYVHIYGAEPRTYIGIVSGGKVYAVYPHERETELRILQGREIEFSVCFLDIPQGEGSLFLKDGYVTLLSWKILNE
jgi:hypothetical protein